MWRMDTNLFISVPTEIPAPDGDMPSTAHSADYRVHITFYSAIHHLMIWDAISQNRFENHMNSPGTLKL